MRKVNAGLFISLDGVTESPDKWQFDVFDDDMGAAMMAHLNAEDTILLGRVTYQEWVGYWPTATDEPYASHINNTPKYVFSTTLDKEVEWKRHAGQRQPGRRNRPAEAAARQEHRRRR
jgi:dihydrofolate reductase